jgi:hypothetical protein
MERAAAWSHCNQDGEGRPVFWPDATLTSIRPASVNASDPCRQPRRRSPSLSDPVFPVLAQSSMSTRPRDGNRKLRQRRARDSPHDGAPGRAGRRPRSHPGRQRSRSLLYSTLVSTAAAEIASARRERPDHRGDDAFGPVSGLIVVSLPQPRSATRSGSRNPAPVTTRPAPAWTS